MIYKGALLSNYEYVLDLIKNRIIKDVLDDYYSGLITGNRDVLEFNQEIYNNVVESCISEAFSDVDLVVLVDSGLIASDTDTLVKFYDVKGFLNKVMDDLSYEDIKRGIDERIDVGNNVFFGEDNKVVVLNSQDYANLVSKIEKDVISKLDRVSELTIYLLYSLVEVVALKHLENANFVLLVENELINSDIDNLAIAYNIDRFCDKIAEEIYDSVKREFERILSENCLFEEITSGSSHMKI
jgi:hypothetical protein